MHSHWANKVVNWNGITTSYNFILGNIKPPVESVVAQSPTDYPKRKQEWINDGSPIVPLPWDQRRKPYIIINWRGACLFNQLLTVALILESQHDSFGIFPFTLPSRLIMVRKLAFSSIHVDHSSVRFFFFYSKNISSYLVCENGHGMKR